ncbi:hypothetical protein HDU87_000911 [Geranomyces variabilis]|uniref:Uncharacterized protein n=1 Tax=Geranomyces variabilis TaxID=109894 RepID=A0AAD5XLK5_9FUNG|nr:hypothetical protein HDU87_000911 [Geranomyces variabilis]
MKGTLVRIVKKAHHALSPVQIIAPLVLYYSLAGSLSLILAVILSSIPPVLYVLYGAVVERKIEHFGVVVVLSFIVTLVTAEATDNVRILLLNNSITLLFMGVAFLWTLLPIARNGRLQRPLIYNMIERSDPDKYDDLWTTSQPFRSHMRALSLMWGLGLSGGFLAILLVVVLVSDQRTAANVANTLPPVVAAVLAAINIVLTCALHRRSKPVAKTVDAGVGVDSVGA